MKPKVAKAILVGVACTIPVGLVVGLSVNWDHTTFISSVGSSGVKPFIEKFGKQYHLQNKHFDVTVESGGTTFAVEQLAEGYTNIGNASNNPYENIYMEGYSNKWQNKKTLTLGWEGLCLLYSLPKGLEQPDKFNIVISKDNILPLYGIFSGWHEPVDTWDSKYEYLWFYGDDQKETLSQHDQTLLKTTKILPFVRSGGNTGANSSIAFSTYSNLCNFETDLTENQRKAFAGGQYGNDNNHMETDESNSRAWQSFVNTNKPGSMVYLTTSFFVNKDNCKQINKHGYKIAKYLATDATEPVAFDINNVNDSLNQICVQKKYNWFRPINVMLDLNKKKAKDFIYWIYFGKTTQDIQNKFCDNYNNTILSLGAKPINFDIHFNSMCSDFGTTTYDKLFNEQSSDINLIDDRDDLFKQVFGAIDQWE